MGVHPSSPREADREPGSFVDLEPLIPELVSGFVDVETEEIDPLIVRALGRVAAHVRADRAIYASLTHDRRRIELTHVYGEELPGGPGPDSFDIDAFPWMMRHFFGKHRVLYIPDFAALPEAAKADRRAWAPEVPAAAFIAGHGDGDPVGVIALQWWRHTPPLVEQDLRPLGVLSDVIAAAIRRTRAQEAFRELERRRRHVERLGFIERLAGGIAHDFNNVLGVILGCAEGASDASPEGSPATAHLSEIVRAVDRAKEMVERLLALARREPSEPKPVDVSALVTGLDSILRTFIGDPFELEIRGGSGVPRVLIDPAALQRLVMNLVVSACDGLPKGGSLRIDTKACGLDGRKPATGEAPSCVRISVAGFGAGSNEAKLGQAFEIFSTDASEAQRGHERASWREIVARAGGQISAQSRPGQWVRFDVLLPATRLLLAPAPGSVRATTALAGRGETILLVEDESALREITGRVLREQGYRVVEAADGEVAWWLLTGILGDEIDLVLTDVVMPNLSGTRLAQRLHEARPSTRVLFVSGYSDDPVLARIRATNPSSVLAKPFTARELAARVRDALDCVASPASDPRHTTGAGGQAGPPRRS